MEMRKQQLQRSKADCQCFLTDSLEAARDLLTRLVDLGFECIGLTVGEDDTCTLFVTAR